MGSTLAEISNRVDVHKEISVTPRLLLAFAIISIHLVGALAIVLSGSMDYGQAVIHFLLCITIPVIFTICKIVKKSNLASNLRNGSLIQLLVCLLLSLASLISLILLLTTSRDAKSFLWSLATLLAFCAFWLMVAETALAFLEARQEANLNRMRHTAEIDQSRGQTNQSMDHDNPEQDHNRSVENQLSDQVDRTKSEVMESVDGIETN